jgi:hypothetical protein
MALFYWIFVFARWVMTKLQLVPGQVYFINSGNLYIELKENTKRFFKETGRIHIVFLNTDRAQLLTMIAVENELYPPQTKDNDLYHTRLLRLHNVSFCIISVPERDEEQIRTIVLEHNYILAKGYYSSLLTSHKPEITFPYQGPGFRILLSVEVTIDN